MNSDDLAFVQQQFENRFEQYQPECMYSPSELLYVMDAIQRVFTDDGKGNGNLIPAEFVKLTKKMVNPDGTSLAVSYPQAILISLTQPDRKQTTELANEAARQFNRLSEETPWQLFQRNTTYNDQLDKTTKKNYFLNFGGDSPGMMLEVKHRCKSAATALISTLAVLRYKADKGEFPRRLEELVSSGYLKNLPMDPYSDKPLIYKQMQDNFTLYSVGANFKDDGGVHSDNWEQDYVFWPVQ